MELSKAAFFLAAALNMGSAQADVDPCAIKPFAGNWKHQQRSKGQTSFGSFSPQWSFDCDGKIMVNWGGGPPNSDAKLIKAEGNRIMIENQFGARYDTFLHEDVHNDYYFPQGCTGGCLTGYVAGGHAQDRFDYDSRWTAVSRKTCDMTGCKKPDAGCKRADGAEVGDEAEEGGKKGTIKEDCSFDPYIDICFEGQHMDIYMKKMAVSQVKDYESKNSAIEIGLPGERIFHEGDWIVLDSNCKKMEVHPSGTGDPHFESWTGEKYDFHGECDLVLFENTRFADGRGLNVHIRTKIDKWWSFIESAAVRIGDHTLEITGGKQQVSYWLDGVEVADMESGDATLGEHHSIHFTRINDHQSQTRIDLGHDNALSIETFKRFVRVNVKVSTDAAFVGSYGMLGSYPGGQKVARDQFTIMEDVNEFGQEWQVLPTEPKLFHEDSAVQHPMKCLMPTQSKKSQQRRRLGESIISEEVAAQACARVAEKDRDACIFDVMATQDKDMAGSY